MIGLIVLCTAVFAFELALLAGDGLEAFVQQFGLVPAQVLQGQTLWSLITNMFLHGSLMHLLGNMYFLYVFGDNVEDHFGHRGFVYLFLAAGLVGALVHLFTHAASAVPALGASGAIAGVMGAYLVLFPHTKLWLVIFFIRFQLSAVWFFAAWLVLQIVMAYYALAAIVETHTAWFVHIGGFVVGLLIGTRHARQMRAALS